MNQRSLADAKAHLSACIAQVEAGEPMLIARHGKAVAALVGMADWQRLTAQTRLAAPPLSYETGIATSAAASWQPVWGAVPGLRVRIADGEAAAPVFPAGVPWHELDPV